MKNKNKTQRMRKKINTFFRKKITIARWQFNLFGLACFSVGAVWGVYLMMSGAFPQIFAANIPVSLTKAPADAEFYAGRFDSTKISGSGVNSSVKLGVSGSWTTLDDAPFVYNPIGDMITDNNGNIFVMNGDGYQSTTDLWRYHVATGAWSQLAPSPASTDFTSMTYDGSGHIFVLRERSMNPFPQWTSDVWEYDISSNSWSALPNLPDTASGGSIVSDKNGSLFAHLGDRNTFWKYKIPTSGTSSWVQMADAPAFTYVQSGAYDNNGHIFYFKGSDYTGGPGTNVFWRYDIASNSWSAMANAPGNVDLYSSSLEYDQNGSMYSTGSGDGVLWKYDIASNVWSVMQNPPGTTTALVYDGSGGNRTIYALGTWGQSSFFKFDMTDAASGSFETAPIVIDWNAGWIDGDSFVANTNLPSGTSISFSMKVATSSDGLADAPWVALVANANSTDSIFSASLNDPNNDSNIDDAIGIGSNKYIKIRAELNTLDVASTPELKSITIGYNKDETKPETIVQSTISMKYKRWLNDNQSSEQSFDVQNGGWAGKSGERYEGFSQYYYVNWANAQDPDGGEVLGYCLNLTRESGVSPAYDGGSGGLLADSNTGDTNNGYNWWGLPAALIDNTTFVDGSGNPKCHFILKKQDLAGDRTEFSMKDLVFNYGAPWELRASDIPYYLNIKTIDASGNLSDETTTFSFKVDDQKPNRPAYFTGPGSFISNKNDAVISWPVSNGQAADDLWESMDVDGNPILDSNGNPVKVGLSGIAGYQYCIGDDCYHSYRWYGPKHTGAFDDLIPADQGSYTMQSQFLDEAGNPMIIKDENGDLVLDESGNTQPDSDHRLLNEGINHVWLRACDKVGNCTNDDDIRMRADIKINISAPSAPQNLTVTPTDSKTNSYAFSWKEPERFFGDVKNIKYCYTVNKFPSLNNCTFTTAGALSLAADAFATQPGENILYLASKGEEGNINYDDYASVSFVYDGAPPAEPVNVDVADISIKSKSDWKLVVSWSAPEDKGAGISSYKIFRSETAASCAENPSAFKEVGSTAGTSFADTGLSQQKYYYCVKAYDSANGSVNRYSNTVSMLPNGKFTEPAEMVGGPEISGLTTSRAVISWTTNRDSDSKVAYGKKAGDYYAEEPSNSKQDTEHKIELNNLSPGTTYYYKAKWTDEDGNTGNYSEKSFKTEPAPTVSDVKAESIGINSAIVRFTVKGASKAKIYYGQTTGFGSVKEVSTSTKEADYDFELNGLSDDTKYYYKINTFDAEDAEYEGTTLDFSTLPRPKISNVEIQQIKDSAQPGVQVTWDSNTEISSIVTYYPVDNAADKQTEVGVDFISGQHESTIMNLKPLTTYELVVRGVDKAGNEASSDKYTLTTASDTRPPQISEIVIEGTSTQNQAGKLSQLTVSWNTDEAATSQVEFGEGVGSSYTQKTQEDSNFTNNHMVILSGLTPSKVYHLRIISKDQAGNVSNSQDNVSITPKAVDSAFELVVGNLIQLFGFLKGLQN